MAKETVNNKFLPGLFVGLVYGIIGGMAIQRYLETEKRAKADLSKRLYALERREWEANLPQPSEEKKAA